MECLIHCMLSDWFYGVKSSWLAICSDMTREQLGKDTKWHNITTCTVADFASEASTMIWAYFSRHFSEYINVDCSGVDKDFITLRITVIAYINTVGLPFFHHCVHIGVASRLDPSVYWRCFGIWHPNGQFSPHDWHVESLAGQKALPGVWDLLQFQHACWFSGFDVFCCCC